MTASCTGICNMFFKDISIG